MFNSGFWGQFFLLHKDTDVALKWMWIPVRDNCLDSVCVCDPGDIKTWLPNLRVVNEVCVSCSHVKHSCSHVNIQ